MTFNAKLKVRRTTGIAFVALGAAITAAGAINSEPSVLLGGMTFIIVGAVRAIRNAKLMTDKKAFTKTRIDEQDEWNALTRYKASLYAMVTNTILSAAAALLLRFIDPASQWILPIVVFNVVTWLTFYIYLFVLRLMNNTKEEEE